jgi:serine/threonine protein kinase
MMAPASVGQLLDTLQQSGLISRPVLDDYLRSHSGDPETLLRLLVRDGLLTEFQAQQIRAGKKRGFLLRERYRVLTQLGAGGMGAVYLCNDLRTQRKVALKVLPPQQANNTVALERFRREARAIAVLDHPNIVRALDFDQDGDLCFLVLEHVQGVSLQQLVQQEGPLEPVRAANCIRQAALGLEHAHQAGLVHRDVKPANLLLDQTGTIKLLDLGLARFFNDSTDHLTQEHDSAVILGTADYIAPEQAISSHDVDIRADIYSLGCTFYFLLRGEAPFQGKSVTQKLICHQMQTPPSIREQRAEVPKAMAAVLDRMLVKAADKRFQRPMEVAEALKTWSQSLAPPGSLILRTATVNPSAAAEATRDSRRGATLTVGSSRTPAAAFASVARLRSRRFLAVAGVVVLLGVLGIGGILFRGGHASSPTSSPVAAAASSAAAVPSSAPAANVAPPAEDLTASLIRGLKDHWKLNEGRDLVAHSSIASGNQLELQNGAAWESDDPLGPAIRFNGRGASLTVANPAYDVGSTFTIAVWVHVVSAARGSQTIMTNKTIVPNRKNYQGFHFGVNTAKTTDRALFFSTLTVGKKGNASLRSASAAVTYGKWQHVAVTVSRAEGTGRLYVNGSDVTAIGGSVRPDFLTASETSVGAGPGGTDSFNGVMADLRVYARTLTVPEIAALAKMK